MAVAFDASGNAYATAGGRVEGTARRGTFNPLYTNTAVVADPWGIVCEPAATCILPNRNPTIANAARS